jgi:hypothetical protein
MSRTIPLLPLIAALLAPPLAGCSSDSDGDPPADAAPSADLAAAEQSAPDLYPDLGAPPDLPVTAPCSSEWIDAVGAQDRVAPGLVSSQDQGGGVTQTKVDATAGGMQQAFNNPWVYVSLDDGSKVEIDDVAAKTSTAWDLAFRRAVIRVNGGDSGAGQGAVAVVGGATFDDVTAVPDSPSAFIVDEFIDDSCVISRDAINNITTAIGSWYDYDVDTSRLEPLDNVYVIRRADGQQHVKLVIDSYYSAGGTSAHLSMRWSAL